MLMILGECNCRTAELVYNEHCPNHSRKSRMAFCCLKNRFLQYSCVQPKRRRQATIVNKEKSKDVIAYVTVNPHASSRIIATENGISQTSVIRILHNCEFHPYHIYFHQNLYENNFANYINFCN